MPQPIFILLIVVLPILTTMASELMKQLDDVQSQIQQIENLKEPAPDTATGAATREQFDRAINQQLAKPRTSKEPLSVILFTTETYRQILQDAGRSAADDHLRLLAECFARKLSPGDILARYQEDTLAIPLPGRTSVEARQLSDAAETLLGESLPSMSRMSILSARPSESANDLMSRAENGIKRESIENDLVAAN